MLSAPNPRKVIIVTGGSREIGAAVAGLAAARGYAVCISYLHNQDASYTTAATIDVAGGR